MTQASVETESARERILRSAARLYAVRGYAGTSMREIANAAGVTKPLIYYHFASKERLYATLLRESIDACATGTRAILEGEGSAAEKLRRVLGSHLERARADPAVYAFAHEVLTMPGLLPVGFDYKAEGRQIFEDLTALIEEGQRRGEFRQINPRAVAVVFIAAIGMYLSAVLSGDLPEVPEGLDETLFALVIHGLEVRNP